MPHDPSDQHSRLLAERAMMADEAIHDAVESAAALAERSLVSRVMAAEQGRATWALLRGQRSCKAAKQRLDRLAKFLIGSTEASLDGFIHRSCVAFYRDAFQYWRRELPGEVLDANAQPTPAGAQKSRGVIIFGLSSRQELQPVFLTAQNSLQSALNGAAIQGTPESRQREILDRWELATKQSIQNRVLQVLSDRQVAIVNQVGLRMIKRELRSKP